MTLAGTHAPTRRSPVLSRNLVAGHCGGGRRGLVRVGPRSNKGARRTAVGTLDLIDREKAEWRQEQDLDIEEERPVIDIPDIEFELSLPIDGIPAIDLRPPR